MRNATYKSSIQGIAIALVVAVFAPSAVKLAHVFTHHTHKVCESNDASKTHLHELDVDCEFYKFKLTNSHFFIPKYKHVLVQNFKSELEDACYLYFLPHQQLVSYLRGPPMLA
jgi:hypothetical protein